MISASLREDMERKRIDVAATLALLDDLNAGRRGRDPLPEAAGVPPVDGVSIVPAGQAMAFRLNAAKARERLEILGLPLPEAVLMEGASMRFGREALSELGERLYARTAWGVLNGGSATSYADVKKNAALGPRVFEALRPGFERMAPLCEGRPKGLAPAYVNPDGSPGESFLVLKMRAALLKAARHAERFGRPSRPALPFFQMTSDGTDSPLAEAYGSYRDHPWLAGLIEATGTDPTRPRSARQPLLAALTHSTEGQVRRVFDRAFGMADSALALPGGHGQGFAVLAGVYRGLLADGYRYAYLGNVDNIGYYPDAAELAVMALSGAEAAFEFSYRTSVDIKGGILVESRDGRRTVADIGQAIDFTRVLELEAAGSRVLFNCATGLFDLERLVPRLDEIARRLPVRVSDQDKDAGRYSQAEQSTWEAVGLLDEPLGFAVEKGERFIAAKLLSETLLASQGPDLGGGSGLPAEVAEASRELSAGLGRALQGACGLRLEGGAWKA